MRLQGPDERSVMEVLLTDFEYVTFRKIRVP